MYGGDPLHKKNRGKVQRICWKYRVSTATRPTNTLKSLLVHSKDKNKNKTKNKTKKKKKKNILETSQVVYEVPYKGCSKSYVGQTRRQLGEIERTSKRPGKKRKKNTLETSKRLLLFRNINWLSVTM